MNRASDIKCVRRKSKLFSAVSVSLALIFVCLANFCTSRIYFRWHYDVASPGGLSPLSTDILAGATGEITMISIFERVHPLRKPARRLLREYELAAKNIPGLTINVRNIDINIDIPEASALMRKYPVEPNSIVVLKGDDFRILSEDALSRYGEVRTSGTENKSTEFCGETACTMAIRQLLRPEGVSVYFLSGHGEYDPQNTDRIAGASTLARILQSHGCSVKRLSLHESRKIPDNCDVLVVAGPRTIISEKEIREISNYLYSGGSAIFMLDSGNSGNMGSLFDAWNINLYEDADAKKTSVATTIYGDHPVTQALSNTMTLFFDPCFIRTPQVLTVPEIADKPKITPLVLCEKKDSILPSVISVAIELGGTGLSGKFHNTRIIVCGDSEFISNAMLGEGVNGNRIFIFSSLEWLTGFQGRLMPPSAVKSVLNTGISPDSWGRLVLKLSVFLPLVVFVCGVFVIAPLIRKI